MNSRDKITQEADRVKELLLRKNASYGDSALKPANVFAKGSAVDNLCSRIDDKLMRIKNRGLNVDTVDTIDDLIGYLILLNIALKDAAGHFTEESYKVQEHSEARGTTTYSSWTSNPTDNISQGGYTWPGIED
jgi:hypothetical protein